MAERNSSLPHEDRLTTDDLFSIKLITTAATAEMIENGATHSNCNTTSLILPPFESAAHAVLTNYHHHYATTISYSPWFKIHIAVDG